MLQGSIAKLVNWTRIEGITYAVCFIMHMCVSLVLAYRDKETFGRKPTLSSPYPALQLAYKGAANR